MTKKKKLKKSIVISIVILLLIIILILLCMKGLLPFSFCKCQIACEKTQHEIKLIRFHSNDETKQIIEIEKSIGRVFEQFPELERDDFILVGWFYNNDQITTQTVVSSVMTDVHAKWKSLNEFELNLNLNGGSLNDESIIVKNGELYGELPIPKKDGAEFDGWYTKDGDKITSETIVDLEEGEEIIAKWKEKFTITFDCGDMVCPIASKIVTTTEPYGELPILTKTSATFLGWYTSEIDGNRIDETMIVKIESDITLYARWTQVETFTVTFQANGGNCVTKTMQVLLNEKYGSLPIATRIGYKFDGWYTDINGGTKVTEQTVFSEKNAVTLYAHWTLITYKVAFDTNGGTMAHSVLEVSNGNNYGSLPIPVLDNYEFGGWYTSKTGGIQIKDTTKVNLTKNITLYARWNGAYRTLQLNPNYNNLQVISKTVQNGNYYDNEKLIRAGYDFEGWFTNDGKKILNGTRIELSQNTTLTARWSPKTYTVYLDKGDSSLSSIQAKNGEYYNLENPERFGYTFDGWYTAKTGGTKVTNETLIQLTSDITLYARFLDNDPNSLSCYEFENGSIINYYAHRNNDSRYPTCPKAVIIPSRLNNQNVTKIGASAFQGKFITSVTIPNTITEIGVNAFASNQIQTLSLVNGLITIKDWAFSGNQITNIILPDTVKTIGVSAFRANALASITIPSSVTSIGQEAFFNNSLTTVSLANGVQSIGIRAFYQNNITSVTIPSSVIVLKQEAFSFNPITNVIVKGKSNKHDFQTYESAIFGSFNELSIQYEM